MQMPPELPTYNPYAAPVSRLEDFPTHVLQLATRGSRLGAAILDGLAVGGIGILAAVFLPVLAKENNGTPNALFIGFMVVCFLVVIGINWYLLHKYGQTIGKRAVGIKVVQTDGRRCELWRFIFLRYGVTTMLGAIPLVGAFVGIVDPLMIFGQEQRCLHDLIANTIVVQV